MIFPSASFLLTWLGRGGDTPYNQVLFLRKSPSIVLGSVLVSDMDKRGLKAYQCMTFPWIVCSLVSGTTLADDCTDDESHILCRWVVYTWGVILLKSRESSWYSLSIPASVVYVCANQSRATHTVTSCFLIEITHKGFRVRILDCCRERIRGIESHRLFTCSYHLQEFQPGAFFLSAGRWVRLPSESQQAPLFIRGFTPSSILLHVQHYRGGNTTL